MSTTTKILIVEHDMTDLDLLQHELKKGGIVYTAEVVQTKQDFGNALKKFIPDLILSDYSLPAFDGPTAFTMREEFAPDTPFIFVSGNIGEENSIEFIKRGLTDYVLKDKLFTLTTKVKRALKDSVAKQQKKIVDQERIQSESRLKSAQAIAHMGSWEIDMLTNIQTWSDELFNIYGTNNNETQPSVEAYLSFIHPGDLEFVSKKVASAFKTVSDSSYDFRFIRKDGIVRNGYAKSHFEFDENNKPRKRHGIVQDVTEKKHAEDKLKKANRLYTFISQINQSIVHLKDDETLFRHACRIALEYGKFKIAWIGMFNTTGEKITLIDQSGIPDQYVKRFTDAPLETSKPQHYVVRTGTHFISNDIVNDPQLESWKAMAAEQSISSCMILPIKKLGNIIGTFNLYATELNFFDTTEIELLEEVVGDISFALDVFEQTKQHKETEELLLKNEKRFRALIEKGSDLIALRSPEGKISYVSPAFVELLGYTEEDLLQTSIFDLIHTDDIANAMEKTKSILKEDGGFYFSQHRYIHKSGTFIWCEGTVTNMLHEPGVLALVSNFKNVSEKKIAEQQQEFDRNNLNALINTTDDLMWSLDKDSKLITSNHAFDAMVKMMSGSIVTKGRDLKMGFNDMQVKQFRQYFARAMSGETFKEIVYTKLPFEIWSEISYYPIYKDEEVVGTACFSRNITEQKKAESQLRLLESVITNTNDAVLITEAAPVDAPGPKIVYVNSAFVKMTGYTSNEVVGITPRLLQGPKTDRHQLDAIRNAMLTGESLEVEIINYKKDGEEFWNNFTIVPVIDKAGALTHCVSIQRDVTSRKRSEEITRTRLEKLVEERTHELNEALNKEKELVELKSKFISIASHEFRTPLSTISFAAESIRNYFHQLSAEEIQRKLIKIEDQASHMTNLLEDILTLGKSEAGKIKVKRISLDLKEFVESLIEEVRATVKEKRIINFTFSCASNKINADDKLLRNVFNNLLTNALKFSAAESVVTIAVSDFKGDLLIKVTDEGIGIDESELASVFESFQRGSNASAVQGTGLGLSILKKAVELMGGSIKLKSKLNEGSTFSVQIPIR